MWDCAAPSNSLRFQNRAQRLINQARNLTSLPYSAVAQFQADITRTQQLLSQAQGVIYNVGQIQTTFQHTYPNGYTGSTSSAQMCQTALNIDPRLECAP